MTTFTTRLYRLHIVKNTDFKIVSKKTGYSGVKISQESPLGEDNITYVK